MLNLSDKESFAFFRLPGDDIIFFVRQILPFSTKIDGKITDKSGFIIYPFDNSEKKPVFINADEILLNPQFTFEAKKKTELDSTTLEEYLEISEYFVSAVENDFQKVVHSKIKVIENKNINIPELYKNLVKKNKNAFVFLFNTPETGTWMGATPEQLLTGRNGKFNTTALAGTQFIDANEEAKWFEKEIKEQKVVMDYIENILNKLSIDYSKKGSYTKVASNHDTKNLVHLATDYQFKLNQNVFELILELHPTPAVSGIPKSEAIYFIKGNEKHNRNYYSGFCGPINIVENDDIALFVNLRSMEIFQNSFVLYLGGGIVKGSDSAQEWQETENKALTLEREINK